MVYAINTKMLECVSKRKPLFLIANRGPAVDFVSQNRLGFVWESRFENSGFESLMDWISEGCPIGPGEGQMGYDLDRLVDSLESVFLTALQCCRVLLFLDETPMKVDVLLGLQWGDEGKGKIVDVLTPKYDIIARFQGGPNAGHTLEFDGRKHVLHTIPSGIFREGKLNLIGNGVVIDPVTLKREIEEVEEPWGNVDARLLISRKAHLILPTHRLLDAANEQDKGKDKIGSTLRGIGPTYMDKTGRNGLRVGDIFLPDFKARYDKLVKKHKRLLSNFSAFTYDLSRARACLVRSHRAPASNSSGRFRAMDQ